MYRRSFRVVDDGFVGRDGSEHLFVSDQEESGGNGHQPQFMPVSHKSAHARQAEVEWRNVEPKFSHERVNEPAEG